MGSIQIYVEFLGYFHEILPWYGMMMSRFPYLEANFVSANFDIICSIEAVRADYNSCGHNRT